MPLPPEPNEPDAPSMTKGASGLILSISFSTGMVGGGVGKVFAGVLPSGVCIAIPELEGRKGVGYFNSGSADPAPIGVTICGVTMTISSVLFLVRCMDWKNLPRIGMSPRKGIFWKVSVSSLSSRPPMTKL